MSSGVGRPRKACSACKRHKVQCSGERPTCKRCAKLHRLCSYRDDNAHLHRKAGWKTSRQQHQPTWPDGSPLGPIIAPTRSLQGPEVGSAGTTYLGIPKALLARLTNAFFDNMYNATLLLHKPSFLASIEDQSARPDVVLSVCVMAANFNRESDASNTLVDDGFVQEWAQRASSLALQDIGNFHPDSLVTFCNLALYWYSQGSWRKAMFYKSNALSLLQTMGLGEGAHRDETFTAEVRRRRLWAAYLLQCHNAESLRYFDDIIDVQKLPLPWPDEEFEAGFRGQGAVYLHSALSDGSIYAELVRVMTICSKVALVNRDLDMPMSERMTFINQTQEELDLFWRKVPKPLKLQTGNFASSPSSGLARIMLINIAYHQTTCSLHASIVPLFSGISSDGDWSHARQFSAQIAFQHAKTASDLIAALLDTQVRASAYPGFLAYAAYCGIAIQMPFMWCMNKAVQQQARKNVQANFALMQQVAKFWKMAAMLLKQTQSLHDGYRKAPVVLEDEPRMIDMHDLRGVPIKTEETSRAILAYNGALQAKGRGVELPELYQEPASEASATQGVRMLPEPAADRLPNADESSRGQHRNSHHALTPLDEAVVVHVEEDTGGIAVQSKELPSQYWWDRIQCQNHQPFVVNPFAESHMDIQLSTEWPLDQTLFEGDHAEAFDFFTLDSNFAA